jgi:hypothetical protein
MNQPPNARRQGVSEGDRVDARGQIIGWEDDYTAIVSFADGLRGFAVKAVPIATLTHVPLNQHEQDER